MPKKPVIFLTFANDLNGKFLEALKSEQDELQSTFIPYMQNGMSICYTAATSEPKNLIRDLNKYKDQLIIFHFSGHNDGVKLQFADQKGNALPFHKSGLQAFLASEKNLKLVFLNGCATENHVKTLQEAGIPAVIATSMRVSDTIAKDFSITFYDSLVAGNTLQQSFLKAKTTIDPVDVNEGIFRGFHLKAKGGESTLLAWGLYIQNETILNWKLTNSIPHSEH